MIDAPRWHKLMQDLPSQHYDQVFISSLDVPQIVTAYLYHRVGVVPDLSTFSRPFQWNGAGAKTSMPGFLKETGLTLFHPDYQNPALLTGLVEMQISDRHAKGRLRLLADHLKYYRGQSPGRWTEAREQIVEDVEKDRKRLRAKLVGEGKSEKVAEEDLRRLRIRPELNLHLHDLLSSIIAANYGIPEIALPKGVAALDRFYGEDRFYPCDEEIQTGRKERSFYDLGPVEISVPVLKGSEFESDVVETLRFNMDKIRTVYLPRLRRTLVIGGSPNSGKSTMAASLFIAIQNVLAECERVGILARGEVKVALCDLDLCSPTAEVVLNGCLPGKKRVWDDALCSEALGRLATLEEENNIVIGDLPGGLPDSITTRLTTAVRYSLLVNQFGHESDRTWREFLASFSGHNRLAGIRTRLDPDRVSGIKTFRSLSKGDSHNSLIGQVVNLERRPKPDDPVIKFLAWVLVCDFLPGEVIAHDDEQSRLQASLRPRLYSLKMKAEEGDKK